MRKNHQDIEAINWNAIEDPRDKEIWDRLVSNFWLPEKVALSNDLKSWDTLTDDEKTTTMRVFTGLTLLDTVQGVVGAVSMMDDAITPHEQAVLANISFMEAFAKGTDLLTSQGWKDISQITTEDRVAQYTPHTKGISFVHPEDTYTHVADTLYSFSSRDGQSKQVVSPGHRVMVEERNRDDDRWVTAVYEAEALAARILDGDNLDALRFRISTGKTSTTGNSTPFTPVDTIKGYIAALGKVEPVGRDSVYTPVFFRIPKEDERYHKVASLCREIGWACEETPDYVKIYAPRKYHASNNGFGLWDNFEGHSQQWFKTLLTVLNEMSPAVNNAGDPLFITWDERKVDFYTAVSTLAGYSTEVRNVSAKPEETPAFFATPTSNTVVYAEDIQVEKLPGEQVWCVRVPSTFLITRNGLQGTVISGNCVHAKSYSNIFMTLSSTPEINDAFRWSRENPQLQNKKNIIMSYYDGDDPLKKKIASVFLESFLFYSGFYLPFYWSSHAKLTNTADIIRLIVRDEALHGYFIGLKYQDSLAKETLERQTELKEYAYDLLLELYDNELEYTEELYDSLGWTEDVKKFLRYNANKALNNLGYEALFPAEDTDVSPAILTSMSPNSDENHDFFSGSGSSYVMGVAEETDDDDWDFD